MFVPTGGANVAVNLNESFTSGSQSQYASSVACTGTNTGAALPSGAYAAGTPAAVQIDDGDDIVCTITNTRKKVNLTLQKTWVGTKVPITIGIDGNPTGNGDQPIVKSVDVGTSHDVSEVFGTAADSALYTTTLDCGVTTSGATVYAQSVPVGTSAVTCTYTNTRKKVNLTLQKTWVGTKVPITIGIDGNPTGNGDQPIVKSVDVGTSHDVSEVFGTAADSALYTTTLDCGVTTSGATVYAQSVPVGTSAVTCTYTNTRKKVNLTLQKTWVGTKVPITIGIDGNPTGNGDQPIVKSVDVGTSHDVSEVFGTAADSALYTTTLDCGVTTSGATVYAQSVPVGTSAVTCTYTNTRKKVNLTLQKTWVGTKVPITIGIDGNPTGNGDQPIVKSVDVGTSHDVSEVFGTAADSALYTTTLDCGVTTSGATVYAQSVPVGTSAVTCTYTNTRKKVTVTVQKQYIGTPTTVELYVGGNKQNVSTNGGSVSADVEVGTDVTVGETAVPSNYVAFIACGTEPAAEGSSKALTQCDGAGDMCGHEQGEAKGQGHQVPDSGERLRHVRSEGRRHHVGDGRRRWWHNWLPVRLAEQQPVHRRDGP